MNLQNICSEDSGMWNRRWCTLNSNEILCWKHPNDELTKVSDLMDTKIIAVAWFVCKTAGAVEMNWPTRIYLTKETDNAVFKSLN